MSLLSHSGPGVTTDDSVTVAVSRGGSPVLPLSMTGQNQAAGRYSERTKILTRMLLSDVTDKQTFEALEASVEEFVDVWTPVMHTTTRVELTAVLAEADDAIGDVAVTFTEWHEHDRSAFVTWLATGRFVRPAFLDDERLIEPTGAVVNLAGITTASFTPAGRADRIRCYFDRLTLVAQLAAPPVA